MAYERRIRVTDTLKDVYLFYKDKLDNPLDEKDFKVIAYSLNKTISDMIIKKSFEFRIPFGLGFLRIKKTKLKFIIRNGKIDINKNIIDWGATWEYWEQKYMGKTRKEIRGIPNKKVIFQTNDHTDGEVMRWYWDRKISNVKNILVYSFKPVKGGSFNGFLTGRLGLGKWIKSDEKENDYYL